MVIPDRPHDYNKPNYKYVLYGIPSRLNDYDFDNAHLF